MSVTNLSFEKNFFQNDKHEDFGAKIKNRSRDLFCILEIF